MTMQIIRHELGFEKAEAIHNAIESNNMDCHDFANAKSRNDDYKDSVSAKHTMA